MEEALNHLKSLLQKDDFTTHYTIGKQFARGAFSTIHQATSAAGEIVVVKKVNTQEEDEIREIAREIEAFNELQHPNLVKCFGGWMLEEQIHLVLEYCHVGSVASLYEETEMGFDEDFIKYLIREMLKGLSFLHSRGIIHRDIKCANTLMNEDGEIKIADLGTIGRTTAHQRRLSIVGTPHWMAPEVCSNNVMPSEYTVAADIWSIGITCIEAAEIDPPHPDDDQMEVMNIIAVEDPPTFANPEARTPEFLSFVSDCLTFDAASRPSAETLLNHRFLEDVDDDIGMMIASDFLEKKRAREAQKKKREREKCKKSEHKPSQPRDRERDKRKRKSVSGIPEGEPRKPSEGGPETDSLLGRKRQSSTDAIPAAVSVPKQTPASPSFSSNESRPKSADRSKGISSRPSLMAVNLEKIQETAVSELQQNTKLAPLPSSRPSGELGAATPRRGGKEMKRQLEIPLEATAYQPIIKLATAPLKNPKHNDLIKLLQHLQKKQRRVTEKQEKPFKEAIDSTQASFAKAQNQNDTQYSESKSAADRDFDKKMEEIMKSREAALAKLEAEFAKKLKDQQQAEEAGKKKLSDPLALLDQHIKCLNEKKKIREDHLNQKHEILQKYSAKETAIKNPYANKLNDLRVKYFEIKAKKQIESQTEIHKATKKLKALQRDLMIQHLDEKHKSLEKASVKNYQSLQKQLKDAYKEISQQLADENFKELQDLKTKIPDKKQYQLEYQEKLKTFKHNQKVSETWFNQYLSSLNDKLAEENKKRQTVESSLLQKNLKDAEIVMEKQYQANLESYTSKSNTEIEDMKKILLLKQVEGRYQMEVHVGEAQFSHQHALEDLNFETLKSITQAKIEYYTSVNDADSIADLRAEEKSNLEDHQAACAEIKAAKEAFFAELKFVKYPTMANYSMGLVQTSQTLEAEVKEIEEQEKEENTIADNEQSAPTEEN